MRAAFFIFLATLITACGIDRISKYLALSAFSGQGVFFLDKAIFFHISNTPYSGLAALPTWIAIIAFILISVGVMVGLYYTQTQNKRVFAIGCGLVLGGGLGNLIDRLRIGHVIDWINVGNTFVCNAADVIIIIGIFICLYVVYYADKSAP